MIKLIFQKKIFLILAIILIFLPLVSKAESEDLKLRDISGINYETKELSVDKYLGWQGSWQQFKENVSLMLTFDNLKKAEKKLIYAENRLRVGQKLLKKDDKKSQEEAIKIISQADSYKYDIFLNNKEDLNKLWQKDDDQVKNLIKNLSAHKINKAIVWSQAEKTVPVSSLNNLNSLRVKAEIKDLKSLNELTDSLNNLEGREDLSLELNKTSVVIENFQKMREEFITSNQTILKKINNYQDKDIELFLEEGLNNLETEKKELYNKVSDYNLKDIKELRLKEELQTQINKIKPSYATSTDNSPILPETRNVRNDYKISDESPLDNFKDSPEYQEFLINIDSSRKVIDSSEEKK